MQIPGYLDENPLLGVFQIHIVASFLPHVPSFPGSQIRLYLTGRNVVVPHCLPWSANLPTHEVFVVVQ